MTRYAILLSVEEYSSFADTPFTHADAKLLTETLLGYCDYAEQHVLCMHLKPGEDHSPSSILAEVKQMASCLRPGDTMVFFFAGHGHLKDGETFLVLPDSTLDAIDSTGLPLRDVTAELRVDRCGCFRILDACHSGIDVRAGNGLDPQGFVSAVVRGQASGWVTLAACAEDEFSVGDSEIGNGVFTHHLCEAIRSVDEGREILPEILKVEISKRVAEHASRIGNKQTPTLNASLSGNLAMAVRTPHKAEQPQETGEAELALMDRIAALRGVEDILGPETLRMYLKRLTDDVEQVLSADPFFEGKVERGEELRADSIPDQMHKTIVEFTRKRGFNTQHEHSRVEERVQNPLAIDYLLGWRQRKVHYGLDQPHSLPPSAVIITAAGDGRCVPQLSVLVYVIPLQVCCCLLVSGFRINWSPRDGSLNSVFSGYRMLRPGDGDDEVPTLAHFSVCKIRENLEEHVTRRVQQLEKELAPDE